MTVITIDEKLINEVIAVSHYDNAQEAVIKILRNYLHQQKKTTLFVACCYSLLPCMRYLRDHRPKSFSPFTLITVSNLGKRVHTQCELLLLRGVCFCFLPTC